MDTIKWLKWRGLVDRPFVYTCFFPHHQIQVQGNKKGKKKKKKKDTSSSLVFQNVLKDF